jgi:hypothetical protein
MFSFHWKKQKSQIVFTIHTLTLPQHYNETFRVVWQRGDQSGETALLFPSDENIILFEKRCTCSSTMYISKKDGSVRPKLMVLKVWRVYPNKKQKLFGKLTIDISKFYGVVTPVATTYTLESPHRKKSTITLTIRLVSPNSPLATSGNQSLTDGAMTSISEAMSIATDQTSVWDVSEVVSEDDKKILEEFMDNQHRSRLAPVETGPSLAQFASPSFERGVGGRFRRQMDKDDSKPISLAALADKKSSDRLNKFFMDRTNEQFNLRESTPAGESTKVILTQPASRNLMKSVLTHAWQESPVLDKPFPKIPAVLFALIEATQVFEKTPFSDKGFSTFTSKFIELFESGILVSNYTKLDMFVISACFVALLPNIKEAIPERRDTFIERISELGRNYLLEASEEQSEILSSVLVTLTYDPSLFETVVSSFGQGLKQMNEKAIPFKDVVNDYAIKHFDRALTLKIISLPGICSFSNAVSWNSFASIVSSEVGVELTYLRQLAQCLIMSSKICEEPEKCREICPDLSYSSIYELIKNQRSDEYMPIFNDISKFKEMYEKEINEKIDIQIDINFNNIVKNINTNGWDKQNITELEFNKFSFLKTHFESKE